MVAPVWAVLTYLLIGEGATEDLTTELWLAKRLQRLVTRVYEASKKLDSIVLLAKIHLLSFDPGNKFINQCPANRVRDLADSPTRRVRDPADSLTR